MIENVFVCVYLPQTSFACRVTQHCAAGNVVWDRRWALNNGGDRVGASSVMYDSLPLDQTSSLIIGVSVAMVTAMILLSQMIVLNKSHLAVSGLQHALHLDQLSIGANVDNNKNHAPAFVKRKSKQKASNATIVAAVGSSADMYLRATHDMFQFELGHHATSTVIILLSKSILFHNILLIIVCGYRLWNHRNFLALSICLFACIVASFIIAGSGLPDIQELEQVADEIRYFQEVKAKTKKK